MARGAVVVIVSDGWELGDPELVERSMEQLSRLAYHVIWVNPRKAARGLRAARRRAWRRRCPTSTPSSAGTPCARSARCMTAIRQAEVAGRRTPTPTGRSSLPDTDAGVESQPSPAEAASVRSRDVFPTGGLVAGHPSG